MDDIDFANQNYDEVPAQTVFVDDCSLLSTDEISLNEFVLYPTISSTEITIESNMPFGKVQVFDLSGKQIMEINFESKMIYPLDLSNLSSGLYFLRLEDVNMRPIIKRFIKK